MADVALTILGGLACMVFMCGVAMWLVPRLMRRVPVLRRTAARIRSQSTIDRIVSWVEDEQPDLRRAVAPDGTVTVLFSDIEDSTRITERLGDDRWLELLEVHDAIVREHVRGHDGFEVKSQGDGFMLAFPSAREAIECAIEIQRALARRAADGELPIRVRMGVHTGEAIQRNGDFYGRSVILAARIADRAHGGEILVSSLVKELVQPAHDIAVKEVEEVELKGLDGRHRLFRIAWGAPEDATAGAAPQLRRVG
jgi:eukaryotic-like serine/threonine-protein kinase